MKLFFTSFSLVFFLFIACKPSQKSSISTVEGKQENREVDLKARSANQAPKNIIIMIGDGMGLTQTTAAMYVNGNKIAFERFPVVGLHKSYSSDNLVTDSAAGATAFSCGKKTYNGAIGVDSDTVACPTLLENAAALGMPTGLIATSTIVHATPAAFFGHEALRSSYENIALQLADSKVDFFVGGGKKFFDQRESDQRNLIIEMEAKGRQVDDYFETPFEQVDIDPLQQFGYFTANDDPLPVAQGRNYLIPATEKALQYLDKRDVADEGFFLMIEGSQIDWGGHANLSEYIISETIEFSNAVDKVLDFAEADEETLVIITADHETGGYAIGYGSKQDSIIGAFTSDYHTGTMIPVYAYGPGSEDFSGIYENTAIYDKLVQYVKSSISRKN